MALTITQSLKMFINIIESISFGFGITTFFLWTSLDEVRRVPSNAWMIAAIPLFVVFSTLYAVSSNNELIRDLKSGVVGFGCTLLIAMLSKCHSLTFVALWFLVSGLSSYYHRKIAILAMMARIRVLQARSAAHINTTTALVDTTRTLEAVLTAARIQALLMQLAPNDTRTTNERITANLPKIVLTNSLACAA